jgi:hypothetical protein
MQNIEYTEKRLNEWTKQYSNSIRMEQQLKNTVRQIMKEIEKEKMLASEEVNFFEMHGDSFNEEDEFKVFQRRSHKPTELFKELTLNKHTSKAKTDLLSSKNATGKIISI